MKHLICTLTLFAIAGCTGGYSGEFVGSPHGYCGSGTLNNERIIACPTMAPDGVAPMDVYINAITGVMATQGAALIAAKQYLCMTAPMAVECAGPAR